MEGVFVASAKQILFETKGKNDAHILLQNEPEKYLSDVYEVVLGLNSNTESHLRLLQQGTVLCSLKTPDILTAKEYRPFWITWNTTLAIGKGTRIDISSIILLTRLDFPINSMRISYGFGSSGYFRFHDKSDVVSTHQTTTSRRDALHDTRSSIVIALAISTGCLGFILLSATLGGCFLWNKRKSTVMGTHSQANPVSGEHYEELRRKEQDSEYQHYATLSV
ncbi:CPMD8-like protein [Mya arenaria]|uniref:CPMD8-like protein n=2 Tax=Mya arenaria TaxID=6604 RepID=A0ABY7F594_MYAAR|nr:uncharacterized protein LOC128206263 isoform X2 [Mya arenaria]WAR17325.1 CPMD8-like protein [Mya arenaria]